MLRLKAEANGVRINKSFDARSVEMTADKRAITQILLNLVSNAVKFTPRNGNVNINTQPDGNHILISVADNGIGISAHDLTKLGNPFFQASGAHNRSHEGTGLGLSVVRGLVGLYEGRILVESTPGKGTKITVRLPVAHGARSIKSPAPAKIEILTQYASASPPKIEQLSLYARKSQPVKERAS